MQPEGVVDEQGRECSESEGGDEAVDRVGAGGSQAGNEAVSSTMREGAPDDEDADWPDGRGNRQADEEAIRQQAEDTLSLFTPFMMCRGSFNVARTV